MKVNQSPPNGLPPLSTTAYAIAGYLNTQLSADELTVLGTFLKTLGDLIELNGKEKKLHEMSYINIEDL